MGSGITKPEPPVIIEQSSGRIVNHTPFAQENNCNPQQTEAQVQPSVDPKSVFEGISTLLRAGAVVPVEECMNKDILALYFGFQSSVCDPMTSILIQQYNDNLKEKKKSFEIMFLTVDKDEKVFSEHSSRMPWLSLPYSNISIVPKIYEQCQFATVDVPSLAFIETKTGKVINRNGCEIFQKYGMLAFPFTEAGLKKAEVLKKAENKK